MKKKQWIVYLVGAAVLVALAWWARAHVHFQWSVFREQLQHLDWSLIALGVAMIWLGYGLRAVRWALLIKPQKRVSSLSLVGSQVLGFTAVALFGRLADFVRPYLVAKRVQLPLSSQIAIYTIERMFDLGSTALIFAAALLFAPDRATLPHHEALERSAVGALLVALALGVMAVVVRAAGKAVAELTGRILSVLSPALGNAVSGKILAFRDGLNAIGSVGDFLLTSLISLVMWGMITVAYLATMHAFVLSPELSTITLARVLVLMAASMASSIVQLPVVGWFTQIGVTAGAMKGLFDVPPEPALGCGAMLLVVTFLFVIPLGLVWARFEHVSLKKISEESELAAECSAEEQAARAPAIREA